jgi:hypothetical protein
MKFADKWPDETRERVRQLLAAGWSLSAVSRETGVPRQTIRAWIDRFGWHVPQPAAPGRAERPRLSIRSPVRRLSALVRDGLALADEQVAQIRTSLAEGSGTPEARERCARVFASLTANARQLAGLAVQLEDELEQRARRKRARKNEQAPARSLDEVRQDFARRLLDHCKGRVPGLDAAEMA